MDAPSVVPGLGQVWLAPAGVRIRRWPAGLASRALAALQPVATSDRQGQVKSDRSSEPLERHRSESLEADSVGLGCRDDLIGDQDLTCTGLPGNRGGKVDGAAEVVAVLDHDRPGMDADVGRGESRGGRVLHQA
jgi:hypothetical protein